MAKTKAKGKPVRDRKGYVMVEFPADERKGLEELRDFFQATTSDRVSLSSVIRRLAKEGAKKYLRKPPLDS